MGRVLAHTALFINRFFDPWKKNNRKILWQKKKHVFFLSLWTLLQEKSVFNDGIRLQVPKKKNLGRSKHIALTQAYSNHDLSPPCKQTDNILAHAYTLLYNFSG